MGGGRRFITAAGRLSGAWARFLARLQSPRAFNSLEEFEREIRRLKGEVEAVRAKRQKEKAAFDARHSILGQYATDTEISIAEVDRQLANLRRIREDRLTAEERAYQRQIQELEHQVQERFGPR